MTPHLVAVALGAFVTLACFVSFVLGAVWERVRSADENSPTGGDRP